MRRDPFVLDIALDQFKRMDAPTVIVPVASDGRTGVFYATYRGDPDWMAQARDHDSQADVAIACCKRAHADARAHCGAQPATPQRRR